MKHITIAVLLIVAFLPISASAQANQGVFFDMCPLIDGVILCAWRDFGTVLIEPVDEPGNPREFECGLNGCYWVFPIGEYRVWGKNECGERSDWVITMILVDDPGVRQRHQIVVDDCAPRVFMPVNKYQPVPIFPR